MGFFWDRIKRFITKSDDQKEQVKRLLLLVFIYFIVGFIVCFLLTDLFLWLIYPLAARYPEPVFDLGCILGVATWGEIIVNVLACIFFVVLIILWFVIPLKSLVRRLEEEKAARKAQKVFKKWEEE